MKSLEELKKEISPQSTFSDEHGNEIDELISTKPPMILRWGTTWFFLLLFMIGLISWFIQYPDIVLAKATLTSLNAPKPVVTKTDGQLVKLNVKEGDAVEKGQVIGYMESTANVETVLYLSKILDSLQRILSNGDVSSMNDFFSAALIKSQSELGELQQPYQVFIQSFITFRNYLQGGFYIRKKGMLQKDLINLEALNENLNQQKDLQKEDLSLAQETFNVNQLLKNEKVISSLDMRNESSKLIGKKMTVPQINSSIITNQAQQNDKRKEMMELDNDISQQKNIFIQSLNTFISQMDEWKRKYLLVAPLGGKVAFSGFIQEHQQLQANQIICYVNPGNSQYYAEIYIPQFNLGKVRHGQIVLLKFPSYPFEQYGALKGTISFISTIPTDSGYLAKVNLADGLITDYGKTIQYRKGLAGQGEVITQNMRLPERFYYNMVKQIKK